MTSRLRRFLCGKIGVVPNAEARMFVTHTGQVSWNALVSLFFVCGPFAATVAMSDSSVENRPSLPCLQRLPG